MYTRSFLAHGPGILQLAHAHVILVECVCLRSWHRAAQKDVLIMLRLMTNDCLHHLCYLLSIWHVFFLNIVQQEHMMLLETELRSQAQGSAPENVVVDGKSGLVGRTDGSKM